MWGLTESVKKGGITYHGILYGHAHNILKVILPFFTLSVNPHMLSSCVEYYNITYHGILYGHARNITSNHIRLHWVWSM